MPYTKLGLVDAENEGVGKFYHDVQYSYEKAGPLEVRFEVDLEARTLQLFRNGSRFGDIVRGIPEVFRPAVSTKGGVQITFV
jgi:hypothetical protein